MLFDFHDTLVHADSVAGWLADARHAVGERRPSEDTVGLVLAEIWSRASTRYPDICWDLDPVQHRAAFLEVLTQESDCSHELATELYASMPARWVATDGAATLLAALAAAGTRVGVVSNIALDIRPCLERLGLLEFVDAVVLSFEVGLVKPDARIFELAAHSLGVPVTECLMVGDSPATDAGAVAAGVPTLILPVVDGRPRLATVSRALACALG
ncbi:HAD family hydrolase [Phycicoccus sonneratiae]|uniref:HAD family hydrolase n=1 Tax=Phycicoccus sonneratiae TaxID=2807628 RepID=A0ABS2CIB2_9MICO|nr:HAD family hydrolase [Phycicoccus sonneraticus]MBM6399601.1 HAD family hydrolase [Phycicoccus sonneraticus]